MILLFTVSKLQEERIAWSQNMCVCVRMYTQALKLLAPKQPFQLRSATAVLSLHLQF